MIYTSCIQSLGTTYNIYIFIIILISHKAIVQVSKVTALENANFRFSIFTILEKRITKMGAVYFGKNDQKHKQVNTPPAENLNNL